MKKMIIIIIILIIILVGMIGYKNILIKSSNNVHIQDITKIETYITKIYMWKEITKESLPEFEDINQANDLWLWEVIKKNIEEYEIDYTKIQEKAKELFGEEFEKELDEKGKGSFEFSEETGKYYAIDMELDQQEDCFLLNDIKTISSGYEVEIVEYVEDYSQEENSMISIKNLNGEIIGKVNEIEENSSKNLVKENIDKFSKKKVTLKKEGDNLYVQKVSR